MDEGCWVYILRCADDAYYVGTTRLSDPTERVWEHNLGENPRAWTYRRRPVKLVWAEHFQSRAEAVSFERQLKGWSRRKKEAVISGEWERLPVLSKRGKA